FFLNALKSEQRKIRSDNNQRREEYGSRHANSRRKRIGFNEFLFRIFFAAAKNIFHHHDRGIHDDSEVNRTKGEKVGRNIRKTHADESKQQRKRNRQSHHERAACAAEEEKK